MKVVCIDDTNRPVDIPEHKWVRKDEIYTIVKIVKLNLQKNTLGVELEEIDLSDCFPYEYFIADRFAPIRPKDSIEESFEQIDEKELEEHL
tara:strand:- start:1021 stop:1293 length:273 start_codon:yes stop_codon:yes gene_type:complete